MGIDYTLTCQNGFKQNSTNVAVATTDGTVTHDTTVASSDCNFGTADPSATIYCVSNLEFWDITCQWSVTNAPTNAPSNAPSAAPTSPTNNPVTAPSDAPSQSPSNAPTEAPSSSPTSPTEAPVIPSESPSSSPSNVPSNAPSTVPTGAPTMSPTNSPTSSGPGVVVCSNSQGMKMYFNFYLHD